MNAETNSLNRYLERCQERMLIVVRKEEGARQGQDNILESASSKIP